MITWLHIVKGSRDHMMYNEDIYHVFSEQSVPVRYQIVQVLARAT